MLEWLNQVNEHEILSVHSEEFKPFGRVLTAYDFNAVIEYMSQLELPLSGTTYIASIEELKKGELYNRIQNEVFGDMPIQIGFGGGYNNRLNALEWHKGNEINVAVTDFVVMIADQGELKSGIIESEKVRFFYLKKGEAVELFPSTLHYCPSQVNQEPFRMIVILPDGTNTSLATPPEPKAYLRAKNKWMICHEEAEKELNEGIRVGILGENLTLKI